MKWLIVTGFLVYMSSSGEGAVISTNPCQPSPCGPNSECRIIHGQAACACLPGYINAPPLCWPQSEISDSTTDMLHEEDQLGKVPDFRIEEEKDEMSSQLLIVGDAECLSGSEWESNCHFCRCVNGVAECMKQSTCPMPQIFVEPIRCKPNTAFERDCNTCICLENGRGLCTRKSCRKSKGLKESDLVAGKECAPNTFWKSQCNDCACSPQGNSHCTEKACLDQELAPIMRCAPNSRWLNECNTCWCVDSGHAVCTRIGCEYNNMKEDPLKSDISTVDTTPKSAINQTKAVVCVANRMFIKDCNTCWCNEDGTSFFCTRKVCVPDLPEDTVENDEKENTRHVRKVRTIGGQVSTETPKLRACNPGTEFRVDCNQCLCDNEGADFSCTRLDCVAINNNHNAAAPLRTKRAVEDVIVECTPGSVFDQDCNVCRCTQDGGHATCTIKRCKAQNVTEENEVRSSDVGKDPNFRCNPGEQFKRECNDCTCSADGKSIFCTIHFCATNLSPSLH